jgi:glycosyltransferase involved in cell wall biosynthesis
MRGDAEMKISAFIITLNEEENLARCLESLRGWTDEIVVVDSHSSDATREIAAKFGARVFERDWPGFVEQKNFALEQCTNDWVFSIDADEEVSPELRAEIEDLKPKLEKQNLVAYLTPRMVWYEGRWIRHGDWYPDYVPRLFYKPVARFAGGAVHERVEYSGAAQKLQHPLFHYTYKNAADHRARIEKYAQLWARSQFEEGRRTGAFSPVLRASFRFVRAAILKRGFLDGALGWRIAALSAYEVFLKYKTLRRLQSIRNTT